MKTLITLLFAALLVGCVNVKPPSLVEQINADYGPKPGDYKQVVMDYMAARLKDPYSVRYVNWKEPARAYAGKAGNFTYGWGTCVYINAKNSWGAYGGAKISYFVIRDNSVAYSEIGIDRGSLALQRLHSICGM